MLKRKMIVIAAVLIVGTSMPVSAAEDEGITAREHARENLGGLTMDTEGLNEKYTEMLQELKACGFGEEFQLERSEFTGYSMDAVQLFEDSYGDLWSKIQLGKAEIPEDFSASEWMQDAMDLRNEMFGEVRSSQTYQNVMGHMDIGSVWKQVSGGLPSAESLLTNQFQQNFNSHAQNEKDNNESSQAALKENTLDLFTESGKLLGQNSQDSFWNAVEDMRDIISKGEDGVDDIFDQMK